MHKLTIETKPETNGAIGTPRKGRSFSALKLAHILANAFWEGGTSDTDDQRPVWMMLTGTQTELRPFLMNLKSGRKAEHAGDSSRSKPVRYALLKSAGYAFTRQLVPSGEVVTTYLPDLCNLDPGMIDPVQCQFLCLTPRWWSDQQLATLQADRERCATILAHARRIGLPDTWSDENILGLVPQAAHVAAYLEQRTRRPVPGDLAFALQLLVAGLRSGVYSLSMTEETARKHYNGGYQWSGNTRQSSDPWIWARHKWAATFWEVGTDQVGLLPGVLCSVDHGDLDLFLAAQVRAYFG